MENVCFVYAREDGLQKQGKMIYRSSFTAGMFYESIAKSRFIVKL